MQKCVQVYLLLTGLFTLVVGCGASTKTKDKTEDKSDASSTGCTSVDLPEPTQSSGQFVFSTTLAIEPCSIDGYIVGHADVLQVKPANDDEFFINNVPAGTHDIIISTSTLNIESTSLTSEKRSLRLSKV